MNPVPFRHYEPSEKRTFGITNHQHNEWFRISNLLIMKYEKTTLELWYPLSLQS